MDIAVPDLISEVAHSGGLWNLDIAQCRLKFKCAPGINYLEMQNVTLQYPNQERPKLHGGPEQDITRRQKSIMTCNTDFAVPDLISEVAHSGGLWTLDTTVNRSIFASLNFPDFLEPARLRWQTCATHRGHLHTTHCTVEA